MKFKKNITVKIGCIASEFLASCVPSILLITFLFTKSSLQDILLALFIVPYFGVIVNFILALISIISSLFDKTYYKVHNDRLIVFDKGNSFEITYSEITSITLDFGSLDKFNAQKMQLIIWGHDSKRLLTIDNPSLVMTNLLKKKSKVPFNYLNQKRGLFIFILTNGIVLFMAVLIKVVS